MDKIKVEESAYLLMYLNTYEKCKFIFKFLESLLSNNKQEVFYEDVDGEVEIKKRKDLAQVYIKNNVLSENQANLFKKFADNRNNIAHEVWKMKVEYKTDHLELGNIIKELKAFTEEKQYLFKIYNKAVEKDNEKINIDLLFESIKKDAEILLDENCYKNIFDALEQ